MKVPDGNRFLSFIFTKIQSHSLSCSKHLINEDMKGEKEQSLLLHWAGLGCLCAGLQSELLPVSDRSPSTLPCPAPATPAPPPGGGRQRKLWRQAPALHLCSLALWFPARHLTILGVGFQESKWE